MISQQLVDQYKGKIWVNSQLGRGSTFTFKLKLIEEDNDTVDLESIEIAAPKYDYKFNSYGNHKMVNK